MSTALAIASVTAVLKDLLHNGVIDHDLSASLGEITVTSKPPDEISLEQNEQRKSHLNLFLYQVTPNPGWRNVGLPSRNGAGDRVSNPPLALDLHYLLTAYGADELHAEILLGYGMQWLHETPVLNRDSIRTALGPPPLVRDAGSLPASFRALFTSELAEQIEQIKITPQALSTEEVSKLWTAFQAKYRPTAAYQASVVLIESKRPGRAALPVQERNVYVVPFRRPVVEQIKSQAHDGAPILANAPILARHNVVIVGQGLRGDRTLVHIGGLAAELPFVSDTQIVARIPDGVNAGIQGVQVLHRMMMGTPPEDHVGVGSNLAAFVLRPDITAEAAEVVDTGNGLRSLNVHVTVEPAIGESQQVTLFLNEVRAVTSPPDLTVPLAYSFAGPAMALLSPPGAKTQVTFAISGVRAASYFVRIQVDGAESPLRADPSGEFGPQITIP